MLDNDVSRRKVLEKLGASTVAIVGSTSLGAAASGETKFKDQYNNSSQARKALGTYANDVLKELASRDIIQSPSPNEFYLNSKLDRSNVRPSSETNGWAVTEYTTNNGVRTAHLMFTKTNKQYSLTLYVQPQVNQSYALVESRHTDERFAIDPSTDQVKLVGANGSDGDADIDSECEDYWRCTNDICQIVDQTHDPTLCFYDRVRMYCYPGTTCQCYAGSPECSYNKVPECYSTC